MGRCGGSDVVEEFAGTSSKETAGSAGVLSSHEFDGGYLGGVAEKGCLEKGSGEGVSADR